MSLLDFHIFVIFFVNLKHSYSFELSAGVKWPRAGNTKEGRITVPLTSCLTGLD